MNAHTINRQIFEFTCRSEGMATRVQKDILHYTASELTRLMEHVLTSGMVQPGHYTINRLEIDLGDIPVEEFGRSEMLQSFSKLLKDKVHSFVNEQTSYESEVTYTETDPDFSITRAFLLYGDVPWWADKTSPIDIDAALEKLVRRRPEALQKLLTQHAGSVPVFQRLLNQYKPSSLSLVKALVPDAIDEFYSNGMVSAAGYRLNHNQLYKSLRKHQSSKGKIISEAYRSKRLRQLLKIPFQGWAGSLKYLRVLSADEIADLETLLPSLRRVNSRTLEKVWPILKKLSPYQLEFLSQQAAVFKANRALGKPEAATPATITPDSNPPGDSLALKLESTAQEAPVTRADAKNKFPAPQASGQSSVHAESNLDTAISASERRLFADGKEDRPLVSDPVQPVVPPVHSKEPTKKSIDVQLIDGALFFTEQAKEATSDQLTPDSQFSKEEKAASVGSTPVSNQPSSAEPGLLNQRSPLAVPPNGDGPADKDPNRGREKAEKETSRDEPTTLFQAHVSKDAQVGNRGVDTHPHERLQREDHDTSREPSRVKPANPDRSEVDTPVRASGAQLKKYVASILKKLPGGDPALFQELSRLSDHDLLVLQKRFTALDQGTDRLKAIEATLKHPYLLKYAWLETLTQPSYPPERPTEESPDQAIKIKGKTARTDALVNSVRRAQAGIQHAKQGLSGAEAVILQHVLEKKRMETASERRIIKKVLQGLPDETLGLLHFFTQLREQEMEELFDEADATDGLPAVAGAHEINAAVYFTEQEPRKVLVENAGLCLIAPYLPTLFSRLGYLDNKVFKSSRFAHQALYLLQYMATGKRKDQEFVLQFNKLLCGFGVEESLLPAVRFHKSELAEADGVLESVITHWRMLKNTSVQGFRNSFLLRKGLLLEGESSWTLQVERKEYDLLLNNLPWGFSFIKLPWMKKHIQVEW